MQSQVGGGHSHNLTAHAQNRSHSSQNPRNLSAQNHSALYGIFFLPFVLTPFAPLMAYTLCVFIMLALSAKITREWRIFLSLTMIFNIAVIYGSKIYFNTAQDFDDDFSRYYQNYLDIYDGISGAFFVWGGGYEIGLPIFYKFLSLLFPKLPPPFVLLLTALTASILLYAWLEIFILKYFKPYERAALVAFALFIDIFFTSLGLTRQCFASIFLLYAFSTKKIPLKALFLAIAIAFHLSSIFIFLAFYAIKRFPRTSLILTLIFMLLMLYNDIAVHSSINALAKLAQDYLPERVFAYFTYYISENGWSLWTLIYAPIIKFILICCVIFSLFMLNAGDVWSRYLSFVATIGFLVYITQIVPTRAVFILGEMLFYFVVFVAFRRFLNLALLFFFPYFLKRVYYYLTAGDYYADSAGFAFFSYPDSSLAPFYYLFQGVLQ